jgi:hypothetical protein
MACQWATTTNVWNWLMGVALRQDIAATIRSRPRPISMLVAEPRVVVVLWLSPPTTPGRWSGAHSTHTLDRNIPAMGSKGTRVRGCIELGSVEVRCRS